MGDGTKGSDVRLLARHARSRFAGLAVAIGAAGCASVAAPAPDAAPAELTPTLEGHPGWCYTVNLNGWTPGMAAQAPELDNFEAPTYVYLDMDQDHGDMGGGFSTGTQELSWRSAREARWMSDTPYANQPWALGHAHWWKMDDATYHIGFSGGDRFWVGFQTLPTVEGLTGVFRYWNAEALGEAGEPTFEVSSTLTLVDCRQTPMVIFDEFD